MSLQGVAFFTPGFAVSPNVAFPQKVAQWAALPAFPLPRLPLALFQALQMARRQRGRPSDRLRVDLKSHWVFLVNRDGLINGAKSRGFLMVFVYSLGLNDFFCSGGFSEFMPNIYKLMDPDRTLQFSS